MGRGASNERWWRCRACLLIRTVATKLQSASGRSSFPPRTLTGAAGTAHGHSDVILAASLYQRRTATHMTNPRLPEARRPVPNSCETKGVSDPTVETSEASVKIEVFDIGSGGNRPIRPKRTVVESLGDREEEIKTAIATCTRILRESSARPEVSEDGSLRVSEISATFGLTFSAEGSIIVSKASVEASLEIAITLERK